MSSELKSETARINGAKSHGPITPEGKARSAANSRRHGLTASVLLAGESDEDFRLLLADFTDHFQPRTGVETDLVEVMAIARWRLRRLLSIETHLFDLELCRRRKQIDEDFDGMNHEDRLAFVFQKMSDNGNSLALLMRYEGSLNRSYDKAFKQLHQLQSNRPSAPPADPVGSFGNMEPRPSGVSTGPPVSHENVPACGAANFGGSRHFMAAGRAGKRVRRPDSLPHSARPRPNGLQCIFDEAVTPGTFSSSCDASGLQSNAGAVRAVGHL
jgi:hypothetical protein